MRNLCLYLGDVRLLIVVDVFEFVYLVDCIVFLNYGLCFYFSEMVGIIVFK